VGERTEGAHWSGGGAALTREGGYGEEGRENYWEMNNGTSPKIFLIVVSKNLFNSSHMGQQQLLGESIGEQNGTRKG